ncbi:hypothetical protein CN918_29945 [Priestia megaterium]|nr:hypothetical protein CN918_29945 [Priestia megaterium]
MLDKLDKKTIQEIISVSNHDTEESVLNFFESGALEVYPNKHSYLEAGWTFEDENSYSILSDGKVVYFE